MSMNCQPTADEVSGMAWWNALSETDRRKWVSVAGRGVAVDAWNAFKRGGEQAAKYRNGPCDVSTTDTAVDIDVGESLWQPVGTDRYIVEHDLKVSGDVWRVHLNDADPLPSSPHAHCIAGTKRFIGCKLHLGSGQLFTANNKPLDRRLAKPQFNRLIELIRPKFPGLTLPIPLTL